MKRSIFLLLFVVCVPLAVYSQNTSKPKKTLIQVAGSGGDQAVSVSDADRKYIAGGVLNGKASILPKPIYPGIARAIHASGAVSVQVLIDEKGDVISASAVSGHLLLRAAAVHAAKGAKFLPTTLSGEPVKVSGIITYNFVAPETAEQLIMEMGYDLADAEITRSFYAASVERGMSSAWTEERLLLEKIVAGAKAYAEQNPPPPAPVEKVAAPEKAQTDGAKNNTGRPPKDQKHGSTNYRGALPGDRFTIVGGNRNSFTARGPDVVNISPETAADLAGLQAAIVKKLDDNETASWYFRYGQALARLRSLNRDDARFAVAIDDLRALIAGMPQSTAGALRPRLDELVTIAESVRLDAGKRDDLLSKIGYLRYR